MLAREALAGLADTLALSREQYDDIRTAVTEACNNVVQHAYSDGPGPLDLEIRVLDEALEVLVRDEGVGIGLDPAGSGDGEFEIGLPVMLALAERLELAHAPYGGTEVQMRFRAPGLGALEATGRRRAQAPAIVLPSVDASVRMAFSSAELGRAILPRLLGAVAARARFSTDRLSDIQLLADALAAHALPLANGSHLEVALSVGSRRRLDLQVGPFLRGGAAQLLSASRLPGAAGDGPAEQSAGEQDARRDRRALSLIERLADSITVTEIGPDELLVISVSDEA